MIEPLTPTEFNRERALMQTKAARHYAVTQNQCYHQFWNRDPQEIVDSLNANIPLSLARFIGNTELGAAINAQLEKTDFPERCIVEMPAGYAFDGVAFSYTAPPEPEPEPEP
jgi:hypothetical protein